MGNIIFVLKYLISKNLSSLDIRIILNAFIFKYLCTFIDLTSFYMKN